MFTELQKHANNDAAPRGATPSSRRGRREETARAAAAGWSCAICRGCITRQRHGLHCLSVHRAGRKSACRVAAPPAGPGQSPTEGCIEALSPCERGAFFSLSQNEVRWGKEKHPAGLYATNGIPAHTWSRNVTAVFATACRLNHACDANAVYKRNPSRGRLTVHATKPIGEGEEITVCYGFPIGTVLRAQRQRHLKDTFGFVCHYQERSPAMLWRTAKGGCEQSATRHPSSLSFVIGALSIQSSPRMLAPPDALRRGTD